MVSKEGKIETFHCQPPDGVIPVRYQLNRVNGEEVSRSDTQFLELKVTGFLTIKVYCVMLMQSGTFSDKSNEATITVQGITLLYTCQ